MQGYILSGIFAIIGVVLGSSLTFSQQLYINHKHQKDLQESDFRNERKSLYIEMLRMLNSSIIAEAADAVGKSDKETTVQHLRDFLETKKSFISEKSIYVQLYASGRVTSLFLSCASLESDFIGAVVDGTKTGEEIRVMRKAIELNRADVVREIKKELGLSKMGL